MDRSALGRLGRFDAVVLTSTLWFLGKFVRFAFPPLFERIAGVYEISAAGLGTLFSGLLFVYAVLQFPSGLLADRFGSVIVLASGSALAAVGALALAVDAPFAVLVAGMLIIGAGTGTLKTVGVRLLSRAYPDRTGRTLGVFDTFGSLGGVAAPAAVVAFAGLPGVFGAGWRTTFLASGVAWILVTAAFVVRVPTRISETDGGGATSGGGDVPVREYAALFRNPRFSAFVAVTVLFSFAFNAAFAFLPLYLTREAGLEPTTANLLFSALFAVSLVQLLTGELSDRTGELPMIAFTLGLAATGLGSVILLTDLGDPVLLGAAIVCLGLGSHGYRPVRSAYLMSVFPASVAGGGLGAVRTLLMIAGASSPALVGYLSETAGFKPAFWLLTATLAVAAGISVVLWLFE
ncbi:MFS transporter [Halorubrum sp. CBA1229]|uniref:MFS transporter n=1 Tax=Halorubrum sp. CBA1229 TaxID=1853699 RepID=UPI000F3B46D2|nr:MFS transporter [Halorubrum sp. CBA1229]QKY16260.1 MFS transporter [Halorubrum sp. CBA1229]